MAASFPTQNSHAREPATNMPSAMATLSSQQCGSGLITLPIPSDDWSRASIIEPNGNDIHPFHGFEKIRQHVSASAITASQNITCTLPYDSNNAVIGDPRIMNTHSMIKIQATTALSSKGNSLTISTKENQAAAMNPRSSAYPWHKDMVNTHGYLDHRFPEVLDQHPFDMNSDSSNLYYQMANTWQHNSTNLANYQPFGFSNSMIQSTQESGNMTEKLFNSKEETVVGWWLNELGQPVYSMSGISMNNSTNSILKDDNETNSRNNDHENNIYQSAIISKHSSEVSISPDLGNNTESESNKRERKIKQSEDQKRNNHLASERKRRANYKNALANLSKLIPRGSGTESQSCLIWKAVNFIRSLEQTNNMLRLKLQDLMSRY